MKRKIKEFESMATNLIGDGKTPDLFFVSEQGVIITISRSFDTAYNEWKGLPRNIETALENRSYGVICSTSPDDENGNKLVTWDDSRQFLKR